MVRGGYTYVKVKKVKFYNPFFLGGGVTNTNV